LYERFEQLSNTANPELYCWIARNHITQALDINSYEQKSLLQKIQLIEEHTNRIENDEKLFVVFDKSSLIFLTESNFYLPDY
jgi:hypothetical protein